MIFLRGVAMKRTVLMILAGLICISTVTSFGGVHDRDVRAQSAAQDVVIPTYIYDFTDDETYTLGGGGQCFTEFTDDGLLCTAVEDDPNVGIGLAGEAGNEMEWILIKFRGNVNHPARSGEIYYTTPDSSYSEKQAIKWRWSSITDDWQTQVIHARSLGKIEDNVLDIRYDFLAAGGSNFPIEEGESLETAFIAFFKTEEEANNFDYDAYIASIAHSSDPTPQVKEKWDTPAFAEPDVTLKADNVDGTLKFVRETGSDNVVISYSTGGNDFSYSLPYNAYILNGPLKGIDDLGRALPDQFTIIKPDYVDHEDENPVKVDVEPRTIGFFGENGRRYVGIFYFLWLGTFHDVNETPRNISKIMEQYGTAAKDMPELWATAGKTFFFAEPLYGYYRMNDEWVVRKHMELLTNAGIDFLYFDVTNNFLYEENALRLMKICHEMNEEGFPAPKVVFYTNTDAKIRVRQAYKAIYQPGLYPDTWMMLDGKPLIIAPEEANIDGFFTIREQQWPNEEKRDNTWPWIDWEWPQELYGLNNSEAISVSVAQHSGNSEFSTSGLYGYKKNRGRSYDGFADNHTADSYKLGTNIQLQFNRAITSGVPYVLVTGWNEWIASRYSDGKEKDPKKIRFIDTFDYEYSRDIEMSRGGYFDNYYMQLASNVSAIRGSAPVILRDDRHQINVTGDFEQWDKVAHYYSDPSGDASERDSIGHGGIKYENKTGRNDIVRVKVTGDATNLYFCIECAENIVHGSGSDSWMQIYLNVDADKSGWYGYDYILNYKPENDYTTTLARYSGADGAYGFTPSGSKLTYIVSGNKLMIGVPMEELGIEYYDRIELEFKIADSRSSYATMEQFYEDGDAAPLGRMNFVYQTYIESVSGSNKTPVVKTADRVKYAESEPDITQRPDDANKESKVNGWLIGGIALGVAAAAAVVIVIFARKEKKA